MLTDPGKSDQSAAAAAYDSLVNQLLTLMDGLRLVLTITKHQVLIQ